ncbi:START domain-containing protein [Formosa sp. PL04]|uniref:START domain-containing protein n=1 Tax=Formosa sp. PL04 TaxID=3081755 RepID=UPI002982A7C3|nr:START domain-containing protein [Formosa sp. PL04]MDW5289643.1 START domain-containing protein [Formosa sp. PL04]
MIKDSIKYGCLLLILMFQNGLAQENWKMEKEEDGIKVYTKPVSTSDFKAFKATMTIDQSVQSFLAVIYDIDGLATWGYKLKDASLLEKSGDSLQIYYAEAKVPFPYKNRDGVYSNSIKWDTNTKTLFVDIKLLENYMAAKEDLVRLTGKGFWKAKVLDSGKLEIIFEMQVDPGGGIPAWMSNMFADDTPYYTMLALKNVIKKSKYQNKTFNIIN